ncbi:MAG TPA: hypothetical protein VGN57_08620 [Pirellulaceae bacterium]|jgi:uncharacterized membrane protein YhaH (DUF805 family)|nr:hypothetical protein [Pirellulaceae bacterium]
MNRRRNEQGDERFPSGMNESPPRAVRPRRGMTATRWWLLRWFGFGETTRSFYVASGLSLALFKYGVEALTLYLLTDQFFTPWDFLNPLMMRRIELVRGAPEWVAFAWFVWSLPFVWIALAMSVRRASSAGVSPWLGLLTLVPVLNLAIMAILACLPDAKDDDTPPPAARPSRAAPRPEPVAPESGMAEIASAVQGVVAGTGVALLMIGIGVYAFDAYGASLFFGTPVVMGAVGGAIYNFRSPRGWGASILVGVLTIVLAGLSLLIFALEGIICLAMAAPLTLPLGALGGFVGKLIAEGIRGSSHSPWYATTLVFLPAWSAAEAFLMPERTYEIASSVVIDSPPEAVWENVVDFPPIPQPDEWYFRYGIACPMEATIGPTPEAPSGRGVGAVRRCIFTTGVFVEPITVWDEPRRLAFDVTDQPEPMFELTPYRHIHPPHLDGTMRSVRGEFRLVALPDGRTRLEGSTWYRLEMFPSSYWTIWSDLIVRRIHLRVLDHIRKETERETELSAAD